jgi:predicted tellurium resistance membrane protein TerC
MLDFSVLLTTEGILSLFTLSIMEIVLGIDNVIFISILANRLPELEQGKARKLGLSLALIVRLALLSVIAWIVTLTTPIITVPFELTIRDLILLLGGAFLIYKSTVEIHEKLEGDDHEMKEKKRISFASVIFQIILLDIVFSFDSILTAIGLVDHLSIMVIAVVISMIIMLIFAGAISNFINRHPTVKMLALSFLLLIGVLLVLEAFHQHVEKGYIYAAISFSLFVEMLNLRSKKKRKSEPVQLKTSYPLPEKTENE